MAGNIESLRREVERLLREQLRAADTAAGFHVSQTATTSRLFVTVSPLGTLNVTVVSPLFSGREFDERNEMFWSWFGDGLSEEDLQTLDFWRLLTPSEAKDIYPSLMSDQAMAA